jgi:multiple sugar transport system substrate-binding protein
MRGPAVDDSYRKSTKAEILIRELIDEQKRRNVLRFPTESELMARFDLGRHSIREAVASCVSDGLLEKIQGKGTFILDKKTAINFMGWISTEAPGDSAMQYMKERFEAGHPEYKVNNIPVPYYHTIDQLLRHAVQCRSLDVVQITPAMLGFLDDIQFLRPLDEFIDNNDITRRYMVDIESNRRDRRIMGLTWALSPLALFYNKKVMEAAGLDPDSPPATLEELASQCRTVSSSGRGTTWGISLPLLYNDPSYIWYYPYLLSFNGGFSDPIGNLAVDSTGNVDALRWLQSLYREGAVPGRKDITEGRMLFASDRIAFLVDGPWMRGIFRHISGFRGGFDSHYGVTTIPVGVSGRSESVLFNHILAIPRHCPDPDRAYPLLRFLPPDGGATDHYSARRGILPPLRDVLSQERFSSDPYASVFVRQMETVSSLPISHPLFIKTLPFASQIVSDIVAKGQDPGEKLALLKSIVTMLSQDAFISVYAH